MIKKESERGTEGLGKLGKRLASYSTVAAGASLAFLPQADAAVHYTPASIGVYAGASVPIDLDGDGVSDFSIWGSGTFTKFPCGTPYYDWWGSWSWNWFGIKGVGTNAKNEVLADSPVKRLIPPYTISAGKTQWASRGLLQYRTWLNSCYYNIHWGSGNFYNAEGYIGVRFDCNANTCYGWIRFEGYGYRGGIKGWAYEDTGGPIGAGEGEALCGERVPTILGTETHDVLQGTDGPDVIHGLGGHDVIKGLGGDDVICGGSGNDTLFGGDGDDVLYGGSGNDNLGGGLGSDTLYGEFGHNRLYGGDGDDVLYGGRGHDFLNGSAGNDTLYGGEGNDTLMGDEGNDTLRGQSGNDSLFGGPGDDELRGAKMNDSCYGGPDVDSAKGCEVIIGVP